MLLFLTPIFYPLSAVPQDFRFLVRLNILSILVEEARDIVIFRHSFNWQLWFYALVISMIIMQAGFAWFMKSKKAFADVV